MASGATTPVEQENLSTRRCKVESGGIAVKSREKVTFPAINDQ